MKSNKIIDNEYEEQVKFTELSFNFEESMKLEGLPVYIKYKNWLKDNGAVMDPRIRYPSYFGPAQRGVVGISPCKSI